MNRRALAEFAGFQLVWLVCAFSAANGAGAPGCIAAALYVGAQVWCSGWSRALVIMVLIGGVIGFAFESLLAASGLVQYAASWPVVDLAPAWIVGLWLAFATTLPTALRLLGSRPLLTAALLGSVVAPLSYWAGSRLGALTVPPPSGTAYFVIAALWGLAFPALIAFQARIENAS